MNIAIIGAGNVGGTLGRRWQESGHLVVCGARDPGSKPDTVSNAEAAKFGEIILLATPWPAAKSAVESLGDLSGKILIDAVNPLKPDLSALEIGTTICAAEQVAHWARGAKVVKAFNTVGYNIMANPAFGAEKPVLFFCGDDKDAKSTVKPLIDQLGFEAVDAGPLSQARLLEPFALLWISLAYQAGLGREIAFKLLRR